MKKILIGCVLFNVFLYTIKFLSKDFIIYELIFNGEPKSFINIMREQNLIFDTQNRVWILK